MATALTPTQERIAAEGAAYTGDPAKRLQAAAELVRAGKSIEDAMTEAGYGHRFIVGHAKTFAGVLTAANLLDAKTAAKRSPAPKAAPKPAETEPEMIR